MIVVPRPGANLTREAVLDFLKDKIAKWWLPDDVQFVETIPHTATGKILKTKLRDDFRSYKLPTT
jgi:fatty-acyl-CoA synthase